jgi:malonate transporter
VLAGNIGLRPPDMLRQPSHTLGNAGVATALLVLGMSLNARKPHGPGASAADRRWETVATVTLKVAVQPGVSVGVGLLLGLPRPLLLAAVACWALLTVQNIFIAASRYTIDTRFTRTAS